MMANSSFGPFEVTSDAANAADHAALMKEIYDVTVPTANVAAPEVTEFDTTSGVLTLTIAGMSADFVEVSRLLDVLSGTSEHGREWWRFVLMEKLDAHHLNEPQETA